MIQSHSTDTAIPTRGQLVIAWGLMTFLAAAVVAIYHLPKDEEPDEGSQP